MAESYSPEFRSRDTARNLMSVHGLRAQAVVRERIAESRNQGDTSGMERWQNVEAAIAELRRTAAKVERPGSGALARSPMSS